MRTKRKIMIKIEIASFWLEWEKSIEMQENLGNEYHGSYLKAVVVAHNQGFSLNSFKTNN